MMALMSVVRRRLRKDFGKLSRVVRFKVRPSTP